MRTVFCLHPAVSGLCLASAALLFCLVAIGSGTPAVAQGWFGIFGQPSPGIGAPQQVAPRLRPKRRPPVVIQPDVETVKTDATIFVDVFGDSLGQLLANGLDDALSDRADVGVIHKAKGSSGLVMKDFYDWPKTIDDLLASGNPKDKIDVAVMMVGSNDRQAITDDGKTYAYDTDEWVAAYTKRVMAIDEAFRKKGIPLVWVGIPITRDTGFANDMAGLNDIYRDAAAKTGAIYVDTWAAFSDDGGEFDPYGPDINGQTVKLRSADGIHFTKAGARKLAHFVEAEIRPALDGKTPPVELPTADAPDAAKSASPSTAPSAKANPVAPTIVRPIAGPIKNLNEVPVAANGELANVSVLKATSDDSVVETALVKGEPATAPKGRVDDFRWSDSARH